MDSSSYRPTEAACEGLGTSIFKPHALERVREHISNEYVPETSRPKVGNLQRLRVGSRPHMS